MSEREEEFRQVYSNLKVVDGSLVYAARLKAEGAWCAVVAEDVEGHLVGCMYLERVEKVPVPHEFSRAWGYVTHAYVRPDAQNMGLGTAILRRLMNEARIRHLSFSWCGRTLRPLACTAAWDSNRHRKNRPSKTRLRTCLI